MTVKDLPLEQFAVAGYVDLLNQAIAAKPDGIFASILDQNAVDQPLRDAIESASRDRGQRARHVRSRSGSRMFYVGGDEEAAGASPRSASQDGDIKHGVCIIHEPGHTGLEARCRGYTAGLRAAGAKVDKLPSSKDATQATEQIKSYLQENGDVDAIFGVGPQPATFALQALDELGKKGDVRVSAYDMTEDLLTEIDGDNRLDDRPAAVPAGLRADPLAHAAHRARLRDGTRRRHAHGPALVDKTNSQQVAEGVQAGFR